MYVEDIRIKTNARECTTHFPTQDWDKISEARSAIGATIRKNLFVSGIIDSRSNLSARAVSRAKEQSSSKNQNNKTVTKRLIVYVNAI